jgi:hypothetical protein
MSARPCHDVGRIGRLIVFAQDRPHKCPGVPCAFRGVEHAGNRRASTGKLPEEDRAIAEIEIADVPLERGRS